MAKVFSIANQKGGVGKTTTTVNLGAGLARLGIPTLIIDLDAQANATSALGIEKTAGKSLYKVLHGEAKAADMIVATSTEKLDLIPSEVDLAAVESELSQAENYLGRLREALAPVIASGKYKAILIDCPPALGMLSMNALGASDHLIVTLQTEYLAMEGLGQILGVVDQLKAAGVSDKLTVGAIVMTMYDGNALDFDENGRVRIDDWEMAPDVQKAVFEAWPHVTTETFDAHADFAGYQTDFMKNFGFGLAGVDYDAPTEVERPIENV